MSTVILKNVEDQLLQDLQAMAAARSIKVEELILELVRKTLIAETKSEKQKQYHELDDLFGSWSESEYQEITKRISRSRKIDKELWN